MELPKLVKKGEPISASNMNVAIGAVRTLASQYPAGEFVKSNPLVKEVASDISCKVIERKLDEIGWRYAMPFELVVQVNAIEQVDECGKKTYPFPKYYYKVFAKNGFVHYNIKRLCITCSLFFTELYYEEIDGTLYPRDISWNICSTKSVVGGLFVHTFSSEQELELTDWTPIEFNRYWNSDCGKWCIAKEKTIKYASALGVSYQSKDFCRQSVFAVKWFSEIGTESETCDCNCVKSLLCFPMIPSKHDSEVDIAIPTSYIKIKANSTTYGEDTDSEIATEVRLEVEQIRYVAGNFSTTYNYQSEREIGDKEKHTFIPYEIVPTAKKELHNENIKYFYAFDAIEPVILKGFCTNYCHPWNNY